MLATPILALGLTECVLRLAGYGYPTAFFLSEPERGGYITNERYVWQFFNWNTGASPYMQRLPAHKPSGTLRIFILGESAAMGTPDPAFGFGRLLEVMLQSAYPSNRFEVINAAVRGIDSHVVRDIARQCARFEPDLFVVYAGNNDFVGLHGADPDTGYLQTRLSIVRGSQFLKSMKLGQLLRAFIYRGGPEKSARQDQDMEFFRKHRLAASDIRRQWIMDNFKANIEDVCRYAQSVGAKIVLCTLGSNLRDFPPLGSLHRPNLADAQIDEWTAACQQAALCESKEQHNEALNHYQKAASCDDQYAELHFRIALCQSKLGDFQRACEHFHLACNLDAIPFRPDRRMNNLLRQIAQNQNTNQCALADIEAAFAQSSLNDHGVPGNALFLDHVHPTFDGTHLLASTVSSSIAQLLAPKLRTLGITPPLPSPTACAQVLAYTDYEVLNIRAAILRLTSQPPFVDQWEHDQRQAKAEYALQQYQNSLGPDRIQRILATYKTAMANRPQDWPILANYASLCQTLKRDLEAIDLLSQLALEYPRYAPFKLSLAESLACTGQWLAAREQVQTVLRMQPSHATARQLEQRLQRSNRTR